MNLYNSTQTVCIDYLAENYDIGRRLRSGGFLDQQIRPQPWRIA